MAADPELALAERLLGAIRARDFDAIAACFADGAELRVLTPHQVREEHGPAEIAARYRAWLGPLEGFRVVSASSERIADRVRVVYRFRGRDPEHGPQLNEHTGYGAVAAGRFEALNVTCAGFRPDGAAGALADNSGARPTDPAA